MFPLNVILFPGEQTALHLFEPRYRQLLADIEPNDRMFGIPYPEEDGKLRYCTVVELVSVTKRHAGGESDIIIEGKFLGKMRSFYDPAPDRLYAGGTVEVIDQLSSGKAGEQVISELDQLRQTIGPKAEALNTEEFAYLSRIIGSLGLPTEQKLRFLKLNDPDAREQLLANLLRYSRLLIEQERNIQNGIFPN